MAKATGKGRTRREDAKLIERRAEAFKRFKSGEKLADIAKDWKCSPATICVDCKLALEEWREHHRASIHETVELEWQLLNWVQLESQLNYERSQDPKQRKNLADPRFLDLVIKSGEHRRKLLGLDKPTKIEAQTTAEVSHTTNFKSLDQLKAEIRQVKKRLTNRKAESKKA